MVFFVGEEGKSLKKCVWSKISLGTTPKNGHWIVLPLDSKIYVLFSNKNQIIWLQPRSVLIFCQIQPKISRKYKDF